MTSFDANILLYAFSRASPFHEPARRFLEELTARDDVAVSELVLVEFYTLLRNPAVLVRPLGASAAVDVVQTYRRHPTMDAARRATPTATHTTASSGRWRPRPASDGAASTTPAWRFRIAPPGHYASFATANVKDFSGFGFDRVWNPVGMKCGLPRGRRRTIYCGTPRAAALRTRYHKGAANVRTIVLGISTTSGTGFTMSRGFAFVGIRLIRSCPPYPAAAATAR